MARWFVIWTLLFCTSLFAKSDPASTAILPPVTSWQGKSLALVAADDDPWVTPCEKSGFRFSPTYDETVAWLQKLVAAAPELKMESIGKSPEGRDIWMIVASTGDRNKPTILAHGGIHSGEIDGKDAGLMLLRDMTVRGTKRDLLEHANFLFIPILNVDGHERSSRYGRVNQRGPEIMGWRTNARNLNLNRDYTKLDTQEVAAVVGVIQKWSPDLYLDLHVTDGADYQYDITFDFIEKWAYSPAISQWLSSVMTPALTDALAGAGHIPGRAYVGYWRDPLDWRKGLENPMGTPRFSTVYSNLLHVPAMLLETHSLKPYKQRVLGTYVFVENAMRTVIKDVNGLRKAIKQDRTQLRNSIPLTFGFGSASPTKKMMYKGIEMTLVQSDISGSLVPQFNGVLASAEVPIYEADQVTSSVRRPKAYWISRAWSDIIAKLKQHGIQMEVQDAPRDVDVTMYRLEDAKFASTPFEGHIIVTATPRAESRKEHYPKGSVRVSTAQPLGDLAVILLEPSSPDSFFQWGFFNSVLQATEYIEAYVMQPMAEKMLANDPKLARAFAQKLASDSAFANSPEQRLRWFYLKTPFADQRWKLFPVGREE